MSASIFRGKRVEPIRAGMTHKIFMGVTISYIVSEGQEYLSATRREASDSGILNQDAP